MSYGLTVRNDESYIQIDSETPRLCAIYSGEYAASGGNNVTITFPAPIATVEPPCIFVRNSEARNGELYDNMTINGSSGNWTGFSINANNVDWRPAGKWFCAVFASLVVNDYGMRVWSDNGSIVFDSGATPVVVTRATNSWSYQSYTTFPTLGAATYYKCNLPSSPLLSDEYFMINPFSRGLLQPSNINWMTSGVRWNYSENTLQMYAIGFRAGWYDMGAPGAVFARLPGT